MMATYVVVLFALCCEIGTQVLDLESEKELNDGKVTIKGFATIDDVCLINIEGTGMVGVPGASAAFCSLLQSHLQRM